MNTNSRRRSFAALAVAAALALAACGGDDDNSGSPGTTAGQSTDTTTGGADTTTGDTAAAPDTTFVAPPTIDPNAAQYGGVLRFLEYQAPTCFYAGGGGFYPNATVLNVIGDKLTYQDPSTREISPWLATEWSTNDDNTEWTFTLRDDVTFSDGTALTPEVVIANYDQFGLGNQDLGKAKQEYISNYLAGEAVDEHTVKFTFSAPSPGFLQATSVVGTAIAAQKTVDLPYEEHCQLANFVGSGPFTVTDIVPDQKYVLTAREDYDWAPEVFEHQGRAYVDTIEITVVAEDNTRIGSLLAGDGDILRTLQAYDEPRVEAAGFQIYAPGTNGVNPTLAIRPRHPALTELDVRKALQLATDVPTVISTLYSEKYPVATSVLSAGATGYKDISDKIVFDPAQANTLLDNAGWVAGSDGVREKNGVRLEINTLTGAVFPQSQQLLELIAQQWKEIGVKLNVEVPDPATSTARNNDPTDIGVSQSHVGRVDPDVLWSAWHSASGRDYLKAEEGDDPILDEALADITRLATTDERYAKAAEAQERLYDQGYVIPLYELPQTYAAAPYVHGVGWEAVGRVHLYNVWLEQ